MKFLPYEFISHAGLHYLFGLPLISTLVLHFGKQMLWANCASISSFISITKNTTSNLTRGNNNVPSPQDLIFFRQLLLQPLWLNNLFLNPTYIQIHYSDMSNHWPPLIQRYMEHTSVLYLTTYPQNHLLPYMHAWPQLYPVLGVVYSSSYCWLRSLVLSLLHTWSIIRCQHSRVNYVYPRNPIVFNTKSLRRTLCVWRTHVC